MGERDRVANANDMSIVCIRQKLPWVLWYNDQCKDWFHPGCVGRGDEEVRELSLYYCPDCNLVVE